MNLFVNGIKINKITNCKYLGVFIDDSLNWSIHIDYIYKKIIKFTSFFYKLRAIVPRDCLRKLFYTFVYPYINYGVEVYANCSKSVFDKLIKLNKKLLRILMEKNFDTPTIELYRTFNVLPIPLLHEMKLLEIVHKSYHHQHLLPSVFQNYFLTNNSVHTHFTRNSINLHIPVVSFTFGQRMCSFRGSKFWNQIPSDLKQFCSTSVFKKNIKHFLLWR